MGGISIFPMLLLVSLLRFGVNTNISYIVAVGINLGFLMGYLKFKKIVKLIDGSANKGRFIAPFYKGDLEELKPNFKLLWSNMSKICK